MTAVEYLKKKERFADRGFYVLLALFVGTPLVLILYNSFNISRSGFALDSKHQVLDVLVPWIVVIVVGVVSHRRVVANFFAGYPEMQYIEEWKKSGESIEDYPVTEEDKERMMEHCKARLIGYARKINTVRAIINGLPYIDDALAKEVKEKVEEIANLLRREMQRLDGEYLGYWELVVEGLYNPKKKLKVVLIPLLSPDNFRRGYADIDALRPMLLIDDSLEC